ncbi:SDR family NAD(P)-dependent oxidoreductase [Aromatoleum petrolei]|uniref:SDR family oxidoreductase n=1 Tax=Aromatoleum petrolei TaxID=76116 RepID=A0ABX1MS04_9RHOO|nr:SDR family oxidoreductase [Aromatoleum petrolei]NMF90710.1 SDR family oxidoreductase [Aromatoleum petrolei]QTQ36463.1 Short-chain alcohol dehydrogenase family protein [Aromatoleum petrolei]
MNPTATPSPTLPNSSPRFDLDGRVALVTGAGANGGIGHALALGFARAGARVAIADIDADGLAQTARELAAIGPAPLARVVDIADAEAVEALFAAIDEDIGRLDILVNVPFVFPARVRPHELAPVDWERMLAVNLSGYFRCCQAALRRMLLVGQGSIINIGSNAGESALGRGALPYGCTKAAVHQMTRELAVEYAGAGIRVNAILPAQTLTPGLRGHLDNPRFRDQVLPRILAGLPQGRLLEPEDYVGPAIFLASDAARAVNGVLLPVDGGNLAMNAGGSHTWPG